MLTSSDTEFLPQIEPVGPAAGGGGEAESRGVAVVVDLDGVLVVLESSDDCLVLAVGEGDGAGGRFRRHGCGGYLREASVLAVRLRVCVSREKHVSVGEGVICARIGDGSGLL